MLRPCLEKNCTKKWFADTIFYELHRSSSSSSLDVNITSETVSQLVDFLHQVTLARVQHHISPALLGDVQLPVDHIQGNQGFRVLFSEAKKYLDQDQTGAPPVRPGPRHHPEPQRAAARDDDDIIPLNVPELHGVKRAGEGLNEAGVARVHMVRHHVDQGSRGVEEVGGHGALGHLMESIHVMGDTHLVVPGLAIP